MRANQMELSNQSDSNKADDSTDQESVCFDTQLLLLWIAGLGAVFAVSVIVLVSIFF
ncbi:hypothetical protein [Nitratireductor luteus]|uniref:hypothetical protein n=1 Tax=Nitratireductor luteus TaxID=2976980 RepID=UPI0022400524|nr:hypothetical protein [Nitratireductor luteus]